VPLKIKNIPPEAEIVKVKVKVKVRRRRVIPRDFFGSFFSKKNEQKSEGFYGVWKGKVAAKKNGVNFRSPRKLPVPVLGRLPQVLLHFISQNLRNDGVGANIFPNAARRPHEPHANHLPKS